MRHTLRRVLILDTDPDTLIALQHGLEHAEVDTTITWDEAEARQLLESRKFDLVVIGDHPPEIDAESFLRELRLQSTSLQCFILAGKVAKEWLERFRGMGALGVLPKRETLFVVEQITQALASRPFKLRAQVAGRGR